MDFETNIAFKEWAVMCKFFREGRQTLILRKGGIIEEGGIFQPEHHEFFLFPTYAHEQERGTKTEAKEDLLAVEREKPATDSVRIQLFSIVTDTLWISNEEQLRQLEPYHFWSPHTVQMRYNFGGEKGIYAMITRLYQMPKTIEIANLESYKGCKSWVKLEKAIRTTGAEPVLSDSSFEEQRKKILQVLQPIPTP